MLNQKKLTTKIESVLLKKATELDELKDYREQLRDTALHSVDNAIQALKQGKTVVHWERQFVIKDLKEPAFGASLCPSSLEDPRNCKDQFKDKVIVEQALLFDIYQAEDGRILNDRNHYIPLSKSALLHDLEWDLDQPNINEYLTVLDLA